MVENYYLRHSQFFSSSNQTFCPVVYGAGSVGSHVVYELAKMGVLNIKVIDFDKVESHNIANQFYKVSDIGKLKVDCLKENIKLFTDIEITTVNEKIDDTFDFDISASTIHIMTLDNIETRKIIFNNLRKFPVILIDIRAGGDGWEILQLKTDNEEMCEKYEKTLQGEFSNAVCGAQTVIYNVTNVASEMCNLFKKINLHESFPKKLRREMKTYLILGGNENGGN